MKDFKVGEYNYRIDIGTLRIMAFLTGKDASDPLSGYTDNLAIATVILYGGMARVNEKAGVPCKHSFSEVERLVDDLSMGEVFSIIQAWEKSKEQPGEKKSDQ